MVCRRARRRSWREPESFKEYVDRDAFILAKRPIYIHRSRNLLCTEVGEHRTLTDSLDRLLESGLLVPLDIENSYFSWTKRPATRRVGFCNRLMRVVGISKVLDSPDIPEWVLDYVVYHESLHLRQRYTHGAAHDAEFRKWEHTYPRWVEAEDFLRRLQ